MSEIVYNDSFTIGLRELFLNTTPKTLIEAREVLDTNGYFGRHKVNPIYRLGENTFEIIIKVELIHSSFVYKWPHNGTYSLKSNQVVYQKKPVLFDSWVTTAIYKGVYYMTANPYGISPHMHVSADKIGKALKDLETTGVIKNGVFRLSRYNDEEVKEFIENMLNFK